MTWTCHLCGEEFGADIDAVLDHLRLFHPEDYGDGPMRWPDGGLVVLDTGDPREAS